MSRAWQKDQWPNRSAPKRHASTDLEETSRLRGFMTSTQAPRPHGRVMSLLHGIKGGVLVLAFLLSMALPIVDAIGRRLGGFSVPGSDTYRAQLTLWLAFLGALLAARESGHLTLSTAEAIGKVKLRNAARLLSSAVAAGVCSVLAYAAYGV